MQDRAVSRWEAPAGHQQQLGRSQNWLPFQQEMAGATGGERAGSSFSCKHLSHLHSRPAQPLPAQCIHGLRAPGRPPGLPPLVLDVAEAKPAMGDCGSEKVTRA